MMNFCGISPESYNHANAATPTTATANDIAVVAAPDAVGGKVKALLVGAGVGDAVKIFRKGGMVGGANGSGSGM